METETEARALKHTKAIGGRVGHMGASSSLESWEDARDALHAAHQAVADHCTALRVHRTVDRDYKASRGSSPPGRI